MSINIELAEPVVVAGVKTSTISMRAPKVRDMLIMDKMGGSDAEKEIRLIASLCDIDQATIEDMSLADYRKLQDGYRSFLS